MSRYCKIAPGHPVHGHYHDTEYGFPITNERALFERLALEIMQAGLSWEIVLKKRRALNQAFDRFAVSKVAAYDSRDITRLLANKNIIRNRLKIKAIIVNAQRVVALRKSHRSFARWIVSHHPRRNQIGSRCFVKLFYLQVERLQASF
jgi:DNA-3-methyladenine glycosylase I